MCISVRFLFSILLFITCYFKKIKVFLRVIIFSLYAQIYVEVERARLTHKLAKMKEEEGNIIEAANIIQELQVETYGSMEKREKVKLSYLLFGIRN